ncbi:MAG: enoyl-ACP reductase FabI [Rickettsiales bacterium]
MTNQSSKLLLSGRKILIIGIANEHSIAYGCARAFSELGAELAITYQNEKAKTFVEPLIANLNAPIFMPCDVTIEEEMGAVFKAIETKWGKLDTAIHSIAYASKEDLHGRVIESSGKGFANAMDISCHSFIRMSHLAEPLMTDGGSLFTMSYYGSEKVVDNYGIMGPIKAALESSVRYLASELGAKNIRVNAISPGPLKTRAASGIKHFEELLVEAAQKAPTHQLTTIDQVGKTVAYLSADDVGSNITGQTIYIDGGFHIMG